jgi:uncharacterized protein YbaA (DUF1428 family)
MAYVDGFVGAVARENKAIYTQYAAKAAEAFKEFGATRVVECWGDDVPEGKATDFHRVVKLQDGEEVIFSWVEYPSKEVRDAVGAKMMNDPRMAEMMDNMPFDMSRLLYGGFANIFDDGRSGTLGYADGAVIAVPSANKEAYRAFAERNSAILKEYGALRVVDAWGDDLSSAESPGFKPAVLAEESENVAYSWIEWASKEARDAGWEKAMADPRMMEGEMPFDGRRMIHGGFAMILDV